MRVSRGALLACIFLLAACDEQIVHDLSEPDANKVLSRLSAEDLGAKKIPQSDGRWAIAVRRDKIVPALAFIDSNRVLNQRAVNIPTASKRSLVPGREEQRFQYERAVAVSIEDSLSAIQGVLEARVHLNLPETDPLFGTRKEDSGSGSVLLVIDSRFSSQDHDIAALVAGAAGIPAAKVTVLRSVALQQVTAPHNASSSRAAEQVVERAVSSSSLPQDSAAWSVRADVGVASLIALFALGGVGAVIQRRRRRVKFPLPDGLRVEES